MYRRPRGRGKTEREGSRIAVVMLIYLVSTASDTGGIGAGRREGEKKPTKPDADEDIIKAIADVS